MGAARFEGSAAKRCITLESFAAGGGGLDVRFPEGAEGDTRGAMASLQINVEENKTE